MLATDLGTLAVGRTYLPNQTINGAFTSTGLTKYTFTVPDAHVEIDMSFNVFEEPLAHLDMTLEGVASTFDPANPISVGPQVIRADLTAGTYTLDVVNPPSPNPLDRIKTLVFNVDLAPAEAPGGDVATAVFTNWAVT